MTVEERNCISCKVNIISTKHSVEFKCPVCSNKIYRCDKCRKTMVKYACKCGFEGP